MRHLPAARTTAEMAHAITESRLARLTEVAGVPSVEIRRGGGWYALRTGAQSNDLNAVVSRLGVHPSDADVGGLVDWFADVGVPASWLVAVPDPRLTEILLAHGATPERTGHWSAGPVETPAATAAAEVDVRRLAGDGDLDAWLDLADACGWLDGAEDRRTRRALHRAVGYDDPHLAHWLARVGGHPVGFASSYLDGSVVDLCTLGVLASEQRRSVGTALTRARLAHARANGVTHAISAPSHDGWELQRSLGWRLVPVTPDTCFYLAPPA